jgi:hypothetical protein
MNGDVKLKGKHVDKSKLVMLTVVIFLQGGKNAI